MVQISRQCWDTLLKTTNVSLMAALCHCDTSSRQILWHLCNFTAGLKEALMNSNKQKWVRSLLLYLAWWISHLNREISASVEDSHKVAHVVNNPELNYSALFQSRHHIMTHKDKKILLVLYGSGVVLFRDHSDPFSKPEELCQPCVRLPVWTLMSGNRTVHAETLMTELCWPQ